MIEITDPRDCCGCSACVQVCPKQCIEMRSDAEGFAYPQVDRTKCIYCGLCNRVCPLQHPGTPRLPLNVYAARNRDEATRLQSSSGGVFTLLAECVISRGGVVFGAAFDEQWQVAHIHAESCVELAPLRGSKYVQSRIGTSYADAKYFLQHGREVLFMGTPCQIAGLHRFLGEDYPNLYTVEILCHGVPSPKAWRQYLDGKKKEYRCDSISRINFRDKTHGWANYDVTITFYNEQTHTRPQKRDPYFRSFTQNLCLRPSCHACRCKNGRSGSDMTLADYWNIDQVLPSYNDDKGTSLLLVYTPKGVSLLDAVYASLDCVVTPYEACTGRNNGFAESLPVGEKRAEFFRKLIKSQGKGEYPVKERLKYRIRRWLGKR